MTEREQREHFGEQGRLIGAWIALVILIPLLWAILTTLFVPKRWP